MKESEYQLIQRIICGDKGAFRIIIQNYKRLVYHIIFRMIHNKTEREELGQEIFIKIYSNLKSFKGKSSFTTWISVIAHNSCINYLKKKKIDLYEDKIPDNKDEDENPFEKIASPEKLHDDIFSNAELQNLLQKEINQLPLIYREIISLYYLEQLNYKEISAIVSLPEGTIKSYMFRARKILKNSISSKFQPEDL